MAQLMQKWLHRCGCLQQTYWCQSWIERGSWSPSSTSPCWSTGFWWTVRERVILFTCVHTKEPTDLQRILRNHCQAGNPGEIQWISKQHKKTTTKRGKAKDVDLREERQWEQKREKREGGVTVIGLCCTQNVWNCPRKNSIKMIKMKEIQIRSQDE